MYSKHNRRGLHEFDRLIQETIDGGQLEHGIHTFHTGYACNEYRSGQVGKKVVEDLNGGVRFVNVPRATVTPTTAGPARPTARRRPHGTRPDGDYGDVRVSTGGRYSRLEREWFCLRLSARLLTKED
jgi:hypothetical protein